MISLDKSPSDPMTGNQRVCAAGDQARSVRRVVGRRALGEARGASSKSGSAPRSGEARAGFSREKAAGEPGRKIEKSHQPTGAGGGAALYVFRWDRQGRKGQACRVTARGTMNSALVAFADGVAMVTSRHALRRLRGDDQVAANCAHWHDGRCDVCGAEADGFEVSPAFACPGWRAR